MSKIEIRVPGVDKIKTKSEMKENEHKDLELITTVSFEAEISPANIARILNLTRQNCPIEVVVSTPQAMFDLQMERLNTSNGEIQALNEQVIQAAADIVNTGVLDGKGMTVRAHVKEGR